MEQQYAVPLSYLGCNRKFRATFMPVRILFTRIFGPPQVQRFSSSSWEFGDAQFNFLVKCEKMNRSHVHVVTNQEERVKEIEVWLQSCVTLYMQRVNFDR
jgi:hypothetical protein